MSKLLVTSDLHLGHKNITKYRTQFSNADDHHNTVFDNLATTLGKRDTIYFLGDVAFDKYWLDKIKGLKCQHKKLIIGNHCSEHHSMRELVEAFDSIDGLLSKRNYWWSHCPIHPQEMRGKLGCIHGHLHSKLVGEWEDVDYGFGGVTSERFIVNKKYFNVCLEHTNYKPITFAEVISIIND